MPEFRKINNTENNLKNKKNKTTAYFAMEFAFSEKIPNYAGGLGVLASDVLYSCADLGVSVVGVSLIYHQDDDREKSFNPSKFMKKRKETVEVEVENRKVKIAIWEMKIKGKNKKTTSVFFLSSYLFENKRWDRDLTKNLYASDRYTRLGQEIILGVGGVRALEAMGYDVGCYHMNEGHCALAALEVLRKNNYDKNKARSLCVFTTHTPISAGHDYFEYDLFYKTVGTMIPHDIKELAGRERASMTHLALNLSRSASSVSEKHNEVCAKLFPGYKFTNITNGIFIDRWLGKHARKLFDAKLKNYGIDYLELKNVEKKFSDEEVLQFRNSEKKDFVKWINSRPEFFLFNNPGEEDYFQENILTIGFARRFVSYKRPTLIFSDIKKLSETSDGKLQIVFSSRCYAGDEFCANTVKTIKQCAEKLRGKIKIVLIPDYNTEIAKKMISGCDVWLNNPIPDCEASGTSGMKAALNGVLNLSIADGWWDEGFKMYPKGGWTFGRICEGHSGNCDKYDSGELYLVLREVADCYYNNKGEWAKKIKNSIKLISFFNTNRAVKEYSEKFWR